jgi:hypothetical protein
MERMKAGEENGVKTQKEKQVGERGGDNKVGEKAEEENADKKQGTKNGGQNENKDGEKKMGEKEEKNKNGQSEEGEKDVESRITTRSTTQAKGTTEPQHSGGSQVCFSMN